MKNEEYIRIVKEKPLKDRIKSLVECVERMSNAETRSADAKNLDDKKYWAKEYLAQIERVNAVYADIIENIGRLEDQGGDTP